jgi:hypothetical protein
MMFLLGITVAAISSEYANEALLHAPEGSDIQRNQLEKTDKQKCKNGLRWSTAWMPKKW